MPLVYYVATIVMCFHGVCTQFESAPYAKDISADNCQRMLVYTFKTQVGPYYDKIIDFEKDSPEDIKIEYAGCDTTRRTPEDSNEWKITPNVDPELLVPHQHDLRWQQQQGDKI
jgi:hypothetical protein